VSGPPRGVDAGEWAVKSLRAMSLRKRLCEVLAVWMAADAGCLAGRQFESPSLSGPAGASPHRVRPDLLINSLAQIA
jgi:hypothetical protein